MVVTNNQVENSLEVEDLEVIGPFTEITQNLGGVLWKVLGENVPGSLHWSMLLITLALAILLYWIRGGRGAKTAEGRERQSNTFSEYLFPADIYRHVSARVDIWLWCLERVLRPFWVVSLLVVFAPGIETTIIRSLEWTLGSTPALEPNYLWMLFYSLTILLLYDLFFYAIHYSMHRFTFFWAIHKVHHSAEVLTPLTRYREHFLAGPIWASGGMLAYSISGGIFAYLFDGSLAAATLFNLGFFSALFGLTGNFRHSHILLHYPVWLSRWLQSPAMHHSHHSYLPQHLGTNLAAVTSIWDRLFGTIYIPEKDEFTPWGLGDETQKDYRSFQQNVFGPFLDWWEMAAKRFNSKECDRAGS